MAQRGSTPAISRSEKAGVPLRFKEKTFKNFIAENNSQKSKLEVCKTYAEKFPDISKLGTSLILCGNTGAGKTHLACAIASHIIENVKFTKEKYNYQRNISEKIELRAKVKFIEVFKLIRAVKQTYSKNSEKNEQDIIDSFVAYDFLILDEVGVQFGSDTEKNIMFEVINERYLNLKPTILISNLSPSDLGGFVGDRVIDRMKENGGKVLVFDWKSYRETKR